MTFFDVRLTSSVLTKFKVTWKFLAEDNTVHDIPYLETLCLTTPEKKKKKKKKKKITTFDQASIILVLKLSNPCSKSINLLSSICVKGNDTPATTLLCLIVEGAERSC